MLKGGVSSWLKHVSYVTKGKYSEAVSVTPIVITSEYGCQTFEKLKQLLTVPQEESMSAPGACAPVELKELYNDKTTAKVS